MAGKSKRQMPCKLRMQYVTKVWDNWLNWHPVNQGPLFNLPATEVLNITGLSVGSYTIWFAVDQADGILNIDGQILVDSVNVIVQ